MKVSKLLLTVLVALTFTTTVNADGPLKMKGFYYDMSIEEGCKLLSTLKYKPEENFYTRFENYKSGEAVCGFFVKNVKNYKPLPDGLRYFSGGTKIFTNDQNGIKAVYLSSLAVNELFGVTNMSFEEFLQAFIDGYSWIDGIEVEHKRHPTIQLNMEIATKRSPENGWSITIYKNKGMEIEFFEPTRPSFN